MNATLGLQPGAKAPLALRTISEVSAELGVPQHILRFWESRFPDLKPLKRGGNRRYYRPADVELCRALHQLLHADGYTVKGVQKLIAAEGAKALAARIAGIRALQDPDPASDAPASVAPAPGPRAQLLAIRNRLARALGEPART
ncbi:MerR family transcriptional regulator [Thermaurantiacus sp.]